MRHQVLQLDPSSYRPHRIHEEDRIWQETNCAADLWIEALHALGLDPVMGLAFALSTDFDGDQWRMFKYPFEDLWLLFGIQVDELNIWRDLLDHVVEQIDLGHLVTIDVDAWHLPDTAGLTYHSAHQKTTLMAQMVDPKEGRLGYFHNTSYYELSGHDFESLLRPAPDTRTVLPPYVESIRLDSLRRPSPSDTDLVIDLTRKHLLRRPASSPLARMSKRLEEDLPWLSSQDLDRFHTYAFGTVRQCGANAELIGSFVEWLALHDPPTLSPGKTSSAEKREGELFAIAGRFGSVASGMKALEFMLARAARGRPNARAYSSLFAELEEDWEAGMNGLVDLYKP